MSSQPTRPEIDFPGEVPSDLVIEDITVGDGAEATPGSTVSAHYVGVAHSTGEEFDASWNRGAPLDFRLGVGILSRIEGRRGRVSGEAMAVGKSGIFLLDVPTVGQQDSAEITGATGGVDVS